MGVQHTFPVNNKSSQKKKTGEEDRIILNSWVIMMKKENEKCLFFSFINLTNIKCVPVRCLGTCSMASNTKLSAPGQQGAPRG